MSLNGLHKLIEIPIYQKNILGKDRIYRTILLLVKSCSEITRGLILRYFLKFRKPLKVKSLMSFFEKNKKLGEAFQDLPQTQQALIRKKKIKGEFTAQEVLNQLKGLRSYQYKIGSIKYQKPHRSYYANNGDRIIDLIFVLYLIFGFIFGPQILNIFGVDFNITFIIFASITTLVVPSYILWKMRYKLFRWKKERCSIQMENISFLANLLMLLKQEMRPNSKVKIDFNFSNRIAARYKTKTIKNYFILGHRWAIWGFLTILITFSIWLFYSNSEYVFLLIPIGIVILSFLPFFILLAGALFGKSPKLKTKIYHVPKLSLSVQLVDGTLLNTSIMLLVMRRKAIKKKMKLKNFQLQKSKWKYKLRSVVRLQLSFPKNRYPISNEEFQANFQQLTSNPANKVKLKQGEKRKAISHQYMVNSMGSGKRISRFPELKFSDFLDLMGKRSYDRLRKGFSETQFKFKIDKNTPKSDLSQLDGLSETVEKKLNQKNIISFKQIANLKRDEIDYLSQTIDVVPSKLEAWQVKAQKMIKRRPVIKNRKNTSITRVDISLEKENLTQINGIGRSTQQELNRIGIYNFTQLAGLTTFQIEILVEISKFTAYKLQDWQREAEKQYTSLPKDDLTKITGIGKTTQEKLYKQNYISYQQLAELSKSEIDFLSKKINEMETKLNNWKERANAFVDTNTQEEDLSKIKGIGKVIQAKLKELGVINFERLLTIPIYQKEYLKQSLQIKDEQIEDWQNQAKEILNSKS